MTEFLQDGTNVITDAVKNVNVSQIKDAVISANISLDSWKE